jgi:hypothetical protein
MRLHEESSMILLARYSQLNLTIKPFPNMVISTKNGELNAGNSPAEFDLNPLASLVSAACKHHP